MMEHDSFYRLLGEKIRHRRKERGLSQESLAKAVGLKRPSMSNIEKGRQNLLLHTFCDIAEVLNSDASSLLPQQPANPDPTVLPDLRGFSEEVRAFLEAGIKTATAKGE
jgi:transcriptional regulator with XRE-family HTH domain